MSGERIIQARLYSLVKFRRARGVSIRFALVFGWKWKVSINETAGEFQSRVVWRYFERKGEASADVSGEIFLDDWFWND